VQAVDVLGDDRIEQSRPLERDQRPVRVVGLDPLEGLEALAVEVPGAAVTASSSWTTDPASESRSS
jgi:hypothetical protein